MAVYDSFIRAQTPQAAPAAPAATSGAFNPKFVGMSPQMILSQMNGKSPDSAEYNDLFRHLQAVSPGAAATAVQSRYTAPAAPAPAPAGGGAVSTMQPPVDPMGGRSVDSTLKYDAQGRPIRNAYSSILDAGGNLQNGYSLANQIGPSIQLGTQGFDEIKSRALSKGPSAWANLANEKQGLEQNNMLQGAQKSAMQGTNSAYNSLRMRGGLSAGQRERIATQGQRGLTQGTQNIFNQGAQARMNIGLQDQQMKDQFLTQLPGLERSQADFAQSQRQYGDQAKQFDLVNKLKDFQGYNAYNSGSYSDAMKEWGATQTANAQAAAARNSGGGFLSNLVGGLF